MPIEFLCSQCEHPVRVPDQLEGQDTTCPHCQNVQWIPDTTAARLSGEVNPFASPSLPQPEAATAELEAAAAAPPTREAAKSRLMIPVVGVIVSVVLGLIARGIPMVMGVVREASRLMTEEPNSVAGGTAGFAGGLTVTVVYLLLNFAALQSMSRALEVTSYHYVLTGFILVLIPMVTGPWCVLALPFSIWGIVLLCDDSVKAAFAPSTSDT